jgi:hypothetical protein
MKKVLTLLATLIGALVVAAVPAQAAAAATVIHERDGQDAFAVYSTINGNIETDAFVIGGSGKFQAPPGAPQFQQMAFLEVAVFDVTTPQTPILVGIGQAAPSTLVFGSGLSGATLVATIPMTNEITGNPAGTAEVDVSWTGFGPVTKQMNTLHVKEPGLSITRHSSGTNRMASATGSILFADTEFVTVLQQGGLDTMTNSEVDIQH